MKLEHGEPYCSLKSDAFAKQWIYSTGSIPTFCILGSTAFLEYQFFWTNRDHVNMKRQYTLAR